MEENRLNIIFDLDNTLISAVPYDEKLNLDLPYTDMDHFFRIYHRPYLQELLDYCFKNFNVFIWTAGTKDYCIFVCNEIITRRLPYTGNMIMINPPDRNIKGILYKDNCIESQELFSKETLKDLNYIYMFKDYNLNKNNTLIIDDMETVKKVNCINAIHAKSFDVLNGPKAISDTYLIELLTEKIYYIHKYFTIKGKINEAYTTS